MAKRAHVSISVDPSVIKLIDERIKAGDFFNRSHAFEFCVKKQLK